ncbi:MAG: cytochrome b [Betaproteobacteria bacterium]|nr:cytochrome b [Betaproteobacteria bacterium]
MNAEVSNETVGADQTAPVTYDRMLVVLHWVLALGLIAQLGLGVWMEDIPKDPPGIRAQWFNLHKSIGICLGLLILWRLGWRVTHSVPAPPLGVGSFFQKLGTWNHRLLYLCMVVLPVSGYLGSSFSPYPVKFFGMALPKLWGPSPEGKEFFSELHELAADVLMTLIALHVLAALWHQFVKRDGLLARMGWSR